MAISTAPREPKNGQTNATRITPSMIQRWVPGRVRKSVVLLETRGTFGVERQTLLSCSWNNTRRNMAMAQPKIAASMALLAPTTARLTPEISSFKPRIG